MKKPIARWIWNRTSTQGLRLLLLCTLGAFGAAYAAGPEVEPNAELDPVAPTAEGTDPDDNEEVVQKILDEPVTTEILAEENCISPLRYDRVKPVDEYRVLFYGKQAGVVWLNQYMHKCIGVRKHLKMVINLRGSRLCSHDHIEFVDPFLGTATSLARCRLGKFSQIPMEQADLILEQLETKKE